MKRLVFALFAVTMLALPICAQVATIEATIPFAFAAGNATLSAGTYAVTFPPSTFLATLVGSDRHTHIVGGWTRGASGQAPALIFHRYGNQYFLSEIRSGQKSRMLGASRAELELKKTTAAPRSEMIVLAMR